MIASYEARRSPPTSMRRAFMDCIYSISIYRKCRPFVHSHRPFILSVVDDYYKEMATTVSLPNMDAEAVWEQLSAHYAGQSLVSVAPLSAEPSMLSANTFAGRDSLTLYVNGHQTQTIVTALFDNLGKGASGAAVQKYETDARLGGNHWADAIEGESISHV